MSNIDRRRIINNNSGGGRGIYYLIGEDNYIYYSNTIEGEFVKGAHIQTPSNKYIYPTSMGFITNFPDNWGNIYLLYHDNSVSSSYANYIYIGIIKNDIDITSGTIIPEIIYTEGGTELATRILGEGWRTGSGIFVAKKLENYSSWDDVFVQVEFQCSYYDWNTSDTTFNTACILLSINKTGEITEITNWNNWMYLGPIINYDENSVMLLPGYNSGSDFTYHSNTYYKIDKSHNIQTCYLTPDKSADMVLTNWSATDSVEGVFEDYIISNSILYIFVGFTLPEDDQYAKGTIIYYKPLSEIVWDNRYQNIYYLTHTYGSNGDDNKGYGKFYTCDPYVIESYSNKYGARFSSLYSISTNGLEEINNQNLTYNGPFDIKVPADQIYIDNEVCCYSYGVVNNDINVYNINMPEGIQGYLYYV